MFYIIAALVFSFLPYLFWKKINLPYILYLIFIFGTLVLGEAFLLYEKIPIWDSVTHFFGGFVISLFSFKILGNKVTGIYKYIFCMTITLSLGTIWEMFEFLSDSLFGSNAMRTLDKIELDAIKDTIKDLFLDLLGSTIILCKKK